MKFEVHFSSAANGTTFMLQVLDKPLTVGQQVLVINESGRTVNARVTEYKMNQPFSITIQEMPESLTPFQKPETFTVMNLPVGYQERDLYINGQPLVINGSYDVSLSMVLADGIRNVNGSFHVTNIEGKQVVGYLSCYKFQQQIMLEMNYAMNNVASHEVHVPISPDVTLLYHDSNSFEWTPATITI